MERIEAFEAMLKAALEQSEAERQKMEALAFILLREQFTVKSLVGCPLIGAGTLVMVL